MSRLTIDEHGTVRLIDNGRVVDAVKIDETGKSVHVDQAVTDEISANDEADYRGGMILAVLIMVVSTLLFVVGGTVLLAVRWS